MEPDFTEPTLEEMLDYEVRRALLESTLHAALGDSEASLEALVEAEELIRRHGVAVPDAN